jgi:gliding motility-associated-like protein
MFRLLICFLFFYCSNIVCAQRLPKKSAANYVPSLEQAGFVKNVGQFTDGKNNPVKTILYGTHIGECGIFITDKGLSYINYKIIGKELKSIPGKNKKNDTITQFRYDIERVDISLLKASISLENVTEIFANSRVTYNYYTTSYNTGNTGLRICKEIIFNNVYPNIDWAVQFVEDNAGKTKLKYNFIIRPGGNADNIKLRYSKNARLNLNETGDITAKTSLTSFTEKAPISFLKKSRKPVNIHYKRKGQIISFVGTPAKLNETLIIDPEVFWATYLPGTQPDILYQNIMGADVATDKDANIFVTLTTLSKIPFVTVDPGNGAFYQDYSSVDNGAMIIMKFSPTGVLLWSTYFAGNSQCEGNIMTVDKSGNVYAMGKITSRYYLDDTVTNLIPLKNKGGFFDTHPKDNFITEFDNNGKLLWSSFFGGYDTYVTDMTTDEENNMYITGSAVEDISFPVTDPGNGAYMQGPPRYGHLIYISQFSSSSKLLWSTHIDGNADDNGSKIEIDNKGNIYVGANVRSNVYPLKDAGGYFNSGMWGFTITRFNKGRQITWCTALPGAFSFSDLTVDDSCNLYVINNLGTLRKFNEKTELVWTQEYIQTKSYAYDRLLYDRANNVLNILGHMNSSEYDFPTKNTECNGSFFYNGQNGQFYTHIGPIFMTYTTDGNLQYCSLADWPYEYYLYSNFTIDPNGDLIYLFKDIRNGILIPSLTDPGNGAYYHPEVNNQSQTPFLMKLTTSALIVDSSVTLSTNCDSNNVVNLTVLCGKAPFTYAWSNGADSSSVRLPAGGYSVTVTDANFLTKTLKFSIPKPPGSVKSFKADIQDAHCNKKDGSLVVNNIQGGQAPYTFSLNAQSFTNTNTFNAVDSGDYIVVVKDANGCFAKDTFFIKNIPGPSGLHTIISAASCNKNDGIINVDSITGGEAPYLFSINNNSYATDNIFSSLAASPVSISVQDAFGCTYSDSVVVAQSLPPDSADITVSPDHCSSSIGSISINKVVGGSGPFSISLDNLSYTPKPDTANLKSGTYTLFIKDNKNCLIQQKINISNIPGPDSIYYTSMDAICGKTTGSIRIDSVHNGSSPYRFSLNNQGYQAATLFSNVPYGANILLAKDNFGCTTSQSVEVKYTRQYKIDILPRDTSVCYGQPVSFSMQPENSSSVKSIKWSTGQQTSSIFITPKQTTPVYVEVTDNNGCIVKDTSLVMVAACNAGDNCVGIPTAFTPNGDGINDAIGPVANGCPIQDLLFRVYNRFGEKVFETKDPGKKWNGKVAGIDQPTGAYVYICSFISNGTLKSSVKGTFLLLR